MTVRTTYDNVVVRVVDPENVSTGGIVLAYDLDRTFNKGVVVYLGEGKPSTDGSVISPSIELNSTVLFPLNAGVKIKVEGEDLLILKEDDLFAVED